MLILPSSQAYHKKVAAKAENIVFQVFPQKVSITMRIVLAVLNLTISDTVR